MENDFYKKIIELIEDNLGNEYFSVEELAKEAGLSRSMLHRKLKNRIGKSATELITEIRLKKGKELLENSDYTSAEIAYKVGISSPSYFSRLFKKQFQISPGEIRKGEKVVFEPKQKKGNLSTRKVKSPVLIVLVILLVVVLATLGGQFFNKASNPTESSIAILPFDNLSSNDDTQHFADGVVEDLLTRLSTLNNLKVISRTSSEMFRNKGSKTIPEIGEILGVAYILEGSVQRESDDIRISVQLIDAKHDDHVLSKQYDRNLNEIFEVQREIAREIATEISPVFTDTQLDKLKHDYTQNREAFKLYQLGRFHSNKRTAEGYNTGIEFYEKAIAEDPDYALAYAGLADNYDLMALQGHIDRSEGNKIAREMAEKALTIAPNLSEAHTVMGSFYTFTDWNWEAAEKEFLKAIELNPNYSTAHQYYAEYLSIMGRDEEARYHMDKALQLDPFSFIMRYRSSRIYYDQEQFDEALAEIKVCLDLNNEHIWALSLEYDIYLALEDDSAALDCFKKSGTIYNLWTPEEVDSVYNEGGFEGITRWNMNFFDSINEYSKVSFYAMLGEYDKTMDLLELAMDDGNLWPYGTIQREFKPLRSNPRFIAIREKMALPPLEP